MTDLKKDKTDLQAENQELKQDKQGLQTEITNLKIQHQNEISKKEQKITKLEKEIEILKNKPPLVPVNNKQETEKEININQHVNNFTGQENLLTIIRQQKETIQKLQTQLKNARKREGKVIKISKNDWENIKQLQEKLRKKESNLTRLRFYWLLSLGIGIYFLFSIMKLVAQKKRRKKL